MPEMIERILNVFRIPDLRRRILFTLGMLAVFRLGGHIPTPGIDTEALQQLFESQRGYAYTLVADRLRIAVLCGNNAKKDKILTEVYKFVEHDLYVALNLKPIRILVL